MLTIDENYIWLEDFVMIFDLYRAFKNAFMISVNLSMSLGSSMEKAFLCFFFSTSCG